MPVNLYALHELCTIFKNGFVGVWVSKRLTCELYFILTTIASLPTTTAARTQRNEYLSTARKLFDPCESFDLRIHLNHIQYMSINIAYNSGLCGFHFSDLGSPKKATKEIQVLNERGREEKMA